MTALMNDAARASLIVGIALLVCTAAARAMLRERIARQHLEALGTWCLIALAVNVFAVAAAGRFDVGAFAPAVVLGLAAGLLVWSADAAVHAPAATAGEPRGGAPALVAAPRAAATPPAATPPEADPPPTAGPPEPAPSGRLWSGPLDDDPPRRGALWSR